MADRERAPRLEALCWLLLLAALSTNTVAAITSPVGAWWDALRFTLSTAFAVALLALVALRLRARRR
jgi:hypothetical protein